MTEPLEQDEVATALRRLIPIGAPAGLCERIEGALAAPPARAPLARLQAAADDAFGYLLALLGDAALAEEALEEAAFALLREADEQDAPAQRALEALVAAGAETLRLLDKARAAQEGGEAESPLARVSPEARARLLAAGLDLGDPPAPAEPLATAARELARALGLRAHDGREAVAADLAAEAAATLDPAGARRLSAHLAACPACAVVAARLREALELPLARCPDPTALWTRAEQRAARERAHRAAIARVRVRVVLDCCYCHAALDRTEAAFCASCLAPHHADCFAEHGRCAALGCEERATVRPGAPSSGRARPRGGDREPRRRRWPILIVSLVGGGALAAAAVGWAEAFTGAQRQHELAADLAETRQQVAEVQAEREQLAAERERLAAELATAEAELRAFQEARQLELARGEATLAALGARIDALGGGREEGALEADLRARFAKAAELAREGRATALRQLVAQLGAELDASSARLAPARLAYWGGELARLDDLAAEVELQQLANGMQEPSARYVGALRAGRLEEARELRDRLEALLAQVWRASGGRPEATAARLRALRICAAADEVAERVAGSAGGVVAPGRARVRLVDGRVLEGYRLGVRGDQMVLSGPKDTITVPIEEVAALEVGPSVIVEPESLGAGPRPEPAAEAPAPAEPPEEPAPEDAFSALSLGDTIEVAGVPGELVELDAERYGLRPWWGVGWDRVQRGPRARSFPRREDVWLTRRAVAGEIELAISRRVAGGLHVVRAELDLADGDLALASPVVRLDLDDERASEVSGRLQAWSEHELRVNGRTYPFAPSVAPTRQLLLAALARMGAGARVHVAVLDGAVTGVEVAPRAPDTLPLGALILPTGQAKHHVVLRDPLPRAGRLLAPQTCALRPGMQARILLRSREASDPQVHQLYTVREVRRGGLLVARHPRWGAPAEAEAELLGLREVEDAYAVLPDEGTPTRVSGRYARHDMSRRVLWLDDGKVLRLVPRTDAEVTELAGALQRLRVGTPVRVRLLARGEAATAVEAELR